MNTTQSTHSNTTAQYYDVIVIGGSAAGLAGALALVRSRRSVLVIDDATPRNASAAHMHNFLTRDGTPPAELIALGRAEVASYGGQFLSGSVATVEHGVQDEQRFRVTLTDGTPLQTRRLLVATGVTDELPAVPGVAERWGRDVLHCPYCHGWEVQHQAIGILATGPNATHQALLFRQLSEDVVIFQHTAPALPEAQLTQLRNRNIRIVEGEVTALEIHDDRLTGVRLHSGEIVPRQALVIAPRFFARADFLSPLGIVPTEYMVGDYWMGTYIQAEVNGATSVPGVWVAGNLPDPLTQVIMAAAAGLKAGAMINADMVMEEAGHPSDVRQ